MTDTASPLRVLILAPFGRDGRLMSQVLGDAGIDALTVDDGEELIAQLSHETGAILVTEEALDAKLARNLSEILSKQPPWSDLPIIILTGQPLLTAQARSSAQLGPRANITLVDRPVRMKTLVTTAEAVLRFRTRQYEIRDLMDALERRVQERDRFLAILGHELRNPLGAILLATQMADPESTKLDGEHVQRIERQTRHLTRLVNDLLDLSRVTSGKIVLKKRVIDFKALIVEVIQTLEAVAETQKLKLSFRCDEPRVLVEGDATRLDQIVSNVLTNALKYTPAGGHVEAMLECRNGQAILRVRDDGVGIAEERLGNIFELFAQAENAIGRAQGGMGIGLALVKNLVELHGGTVTASSDGVGKGSEFSITFPLAAVSDHQPLVRKQTAPRGSASRRIVVVEDNPDVRDLLRLKLKRLGHEVDAASDGATGLDTILERSPDIAFVDIGLPSMDGYEIAQRVRQQLGSAVFLVALSGFGQPDDKRKAIEAGFDEHMTKPAEMSDIERVLAESGRG